MYEPANVIRAVPLADFHARVTFSDGTERVINLWPYVNHGGIFAKIRSDQGFFQAMIVENDTVTWPNGADIDPDALYLGLRPHASEEEWRATVQTLQPLTS